MYFLFIALGIIYIFAFIELKNKHKIYIKPIEKQDYLEFKIMKINFSAPIKNQSEKFKNLLSEFKGLGNFKILIQRGKHKKVDYFLFLNEIILKEVKEIIKQVYQNEIWIEEVEQNKENEIWQNLYQKEGFVYLPN